MGQKRIPRLPIYLDSPMAASGMSIYRYYASEHDLSEGLAIRSDFEFDFEKVRLARSVADSRRINDEKGPAVIISSSGMMTGGRILHHLRQRLPGEDNTIVLGGFMAAGTRGRALQEGARTLRIFGRDVPVRAAVVELSALSAHADRSELLRWLHLPKPPRQTFLTHGERASASSLAERLKRERGWNVIVPKMGQCVELSSA
jgi:metallo-beta-lactamase family protein